jgi:hypothetical protein
MLGSWLLVEPPQAAEVGPSGSWTPLIEMSRRAIASLLDGPPPAPASTRSMVTHAIVGTTVTSLGRCVASALSLVSGDVCRLSHLTHLPTVHALGSLPSDLLMQVLASLDVLTLCRLARVSVAFRHLADDSVVWRSACGCRGQHAGHCKDHARLRHVRARMWAEEVEARAELKRKVAFRMWKRRLMNCLQTVCGAALILIPLFLLYRRAGHAGSRHAGKVASAPRVAGAANVPAHHAPPYGSDVSTSRLVYADVVWDAACTYRRPAARST